MPGEADREFRCDVCGRVDTYKLPRFTLVRPTCCDQRMRAGGVVGADQRMADVRIDVIEDRKQPWRLLPDDWNRRQRIIANSPHWNDLYQVWQRGQGRLWGAEFVGMIGCVGETWEFDSGAGVPDHLRRGSAPTKMLAAAAMIRNLGA